MNAVGSETRADALLNRQVRDFVRWDEQTKANVTTGIAAHEQVLYRIFKR